MRKMELFIGPCVLESRELVNSLADRIKNDLSHLSDKVNITFKGSYDKANRTSIDSYRGPGMDEGLRMLEMVKKNFELPVLTDFHYPEQAQVVAHVVDVLQIPAFLCRQTDMVVKGAEACKKYDRILKVKKGQFLAPEDTAQIVKKANSVLDKSKILLTERGSSFGYNNLIVDMASFQIMKSFGVKTVHDATHCVQRPGGLGNITGGKREQIEVLARAAVAAGADGVFMETHVNPDEALSDKTTSLPIEMIKPLVERLVNIYEVVNQ